MIELMIGIIIGATFHEFWNQVYKFAKKKVSSWTSDQEKAERTD